MYKLKKPTKGDRTVFHKFYVPSQIHRHKFYQEMPVSKAHSGILIGKTVCYEGQIIWGSEDEPNSFIPEKSITFWLVEPNKTDRYLKPFLVKEEDLILQLEEVLDAQTN